MTTISPPPSRLKNLGIRLGQNIATSRHAMGWTQQELAEKVGIESVTVSRIETGGSIPSLARLAAVADALKVSIGDLLGGVSPHASDQAQEIAECLNRLQEEDRYLLLDTIKRLAERLERG